MVMIKRKVVSNEWIRSGWRISGQVIRVGTGRFATYNLTQIETTVQMCKNILRGIGSIGILPENSLSFRKHL